MRSLRIVGLIVVVAALVLGAAQAGSGLAATSPVVPAGGKVAGRGYAYYFKRLQLLITPSTRPLPSCSTVTVGGQKVAMLNLNQPQGGTVTCNEPAGRAIYVALIGITCSTQRGFHGGLAPPSVWTNLGSGTSDADLVKCAKLGFHPPVGNSATLDGHTVNLRPLVTSTGVFFVPKMLDGPARVAAYGVGILLRGLSKGTHTIQGHVKGVGPHPATPKFTLKVHAA
jgi:hypothetical protein